MTSHHKTTKKRNAGRPWSNGTVSIWGVVLYHYSPFGEWKDGKVIEKGTMCKMARGQMVRWLAENNITNRANIRAFDQLGYRFQPELSNESHYVFLKNGTEKISTRG